MDCIRKVRKLGTNVAACALLPFALWGICSAAISLPWSTTYNCADWNTYNDPLNCDGLGKYGAWTCSGKYEQITSAANMPGGGGGKGQRHWIGDGQNVNSGSTNITFNTPQNEVWIRWYMRYQSGFKWSSLGYDKLIYFSDAGGIIPEFAWGNGFRVYAQGNAGDYGCSNCGWYTMYPSGSSDGSWHCLEVHLKRNTSGNNGVVQYWLNGALKIDVHNANLNDGTTFSRFALMENQNNPNNGGCYYADVDDVAISNSGYIGPLGGSPIQTSGPKPANEPALNNTFAWSVSRGGLEFKVQAAQPGDIQISVYDLSGKKIMHKQVSAKTAGVYNLSWGPGPITGVCFAVLEKGGQKIARKLAIVP